MPEITLVSDFNRTSSAVKKRYPSKVQFKSYSSARTFDGILFKADTYWQFSVKNAEDFVMPAMNFYIVNDELNYRYPVYLDSKTSDGLTRLQLAEEIIKVVNIFDLISTPCPFDQEEKSEKYKMKVVRKKKVTDSPVSPVREKTLTKMIKSLVKTDGKYNGFPVYKIDYEVV